MVSPSSGRIPAATLFLLAAMMLAPTCSAAEPVKVRYFYGLDPEDLPCYHPNVVPFAEECAAFVLGVADPVVAAVLSYEGDLTAWSDASTEALSAWANSYSGAVSAWATGTTGVAPGWATTTATGASDWASTYAGDASAWSTGVAGGAPSWVTGPAASYATGYASALSDRVTADPFVLYVQCRIFSPTPCGPMPVPSTDLPPLPPNPPVPPFGTPPVSTPPVTDPFVTPPISVPPVSLPPTP